MDRIQSDTAVLVELGARLARLRLRMNLTQTQLAREAGVSKRTLIRLESGECGQLTNLLRVLRALGLPGNLEALVPPPLPSPIEQLRSRSKVRRRASPHAKPRAAVNPWTWRDDPPAHGRTP